MPSIDATNVSRGMTENIEGGDPSAAEVLDNWELDELGIPQQRPGIVPVNPDVPQLPSGNAVVKFVRSVQFDSSTYRLVASTGSNTYVLNDTSSPSWISATGLSTIDVYDFEVINYHLILCGSVSSRVLVDSGGYELVPLGANDGDDLLTVTPQSNDSKNYIYYIHFMETHDFFNGANTFEARGAINFKAVTGGADFSGSGHYHLVDDLPSGSSPGMILRVFRTEHNGTIPYHLKDISNGAVYFTDNTPDANLGSETLYTTNGHVEVARPQSATLITKTGDIAWYVYSADTTKVYQALSGNFAEVPPTYYVQFSDKVRGLATTGEYPIVITEKKVLRIEGSLDAFGNGYHRIREIGDIGISDSTSFRFSIIERDKKVYFFGDDGVYETDGFVLRCISPHLRKFFTDPVDTYYAKKTTLFRVPINSFGTYYSTKKQLVWPIYFQRRESRDSYRNYADGLLILDLRQQIVNGEGCFYVWSNPLDNLQITSVAAFRYGTQASRGESYAFLAFGERYGNVLKFDPDELTDPVAVEGVDYDDWERTAIVPDYRSTLFDGGSRLVRKWSSKIVAVFESLTNISVKIYTRLGKTTSWVGMKGIFHEGGSPLEYVTAKRHLPKKTLRWNFRQIRITKDEKIVVNSDDTATVTLNVAMKTVQLASGTWQGDLIGMSIYFETYNGGQDPYSIGFVISVQSGDTLTLATISDMDAGSGLKFQVKGYAKDEKLRMIGYSIPYTGVGDAQRGFKSEDEGENA